MGVCRYWNGSFGLRAGVSTIRVRDQRMGIGVAYFSVIENET